MGQGGILDDQEYQGHHCRHDDDDDNVGSNDVNDEGQRPVTFLDMVKKCVTLEPIIRF